ncbi:hypothetical protein [Parasphingorhabdus sp.]
MAQSVNTSRRGAMKLAAAFAIALPMTGASFITLAPEAHAQVTKKRVDGIYQATDNGSLINEFKMDIFGGLEVFPIRRGKKGKAVIYEKVKDGVWREAGLFKKNRATYTFTNSGAMVWKRGATKITLVRTGQIAGDTNKYNLEGEFRFANNRRNINKFRMTDGNTATVTPIRKGKTGKAVTYKRISDSEFKDTRGSGVYTVLPNGNLLWESRDNRNTRINLTKK